MRRVFRRRDALMMMAGGVGTAAVLGPVVRANAEDQSVTMYVLPGALTGPDGKGHDSFVPSSFVVKAGSPVRLQVINYDTGAHTVTAPDLGLNLQVNPGTKAGGKTTPVTTTTTLRRPRPARTGGSAGCSVTGQATGRWTPATRDPGKKAIWRASSSSCKRATIHAGARAAARCPRAPHHPYPNRCQRSGRETDTPPEMISQRWHGM